MRLGLACQRDEVRIGERLIGDGCAPYVIAEIGSNHDGLFITALEMIEEAARCGADAAKFQLYRSDELYPGTHTEGALPDEWLPLLKKTCRDNGIDFLCSVFSLETLEAYMDVEPVAVKIASPEAVRLDLIECAQSYGVPVIVATGACDDIDVDIIVSTVVKVPLILLHCVSAYPAPAVEMNLRAIASMARRQKVPVGLSDHTLDGPAPAAAVALGACVVEKHLTFDRTLPGPDHPFALEPQEFARMVRDVRAVSEMLGDGVKRVTASEDPLDRRVAA